MQQEAVLVGTMMHTFLRAQTLLTPPSSRGNGEAQH